MQARLWAWGRGTGPHQFLAATLTLFQPGGADCPHQVLKATANRATASCPEYQNYCFMDEYFLLSTICLI
jgi:hypothetical protein